MNQPSYSWNEKPIPENITQNWQEILNLLAQIIQVPASLIMRVHPPIIEVFLRNKSPTNPYEKGETAELSGLYCNTVMNTDRHLLVPNALKDPKWDSNPDIELNMLSYLGFPIKWPNGDVFGTICVLDQKENAFDTLYIQLLVQFKKMVENHLQILTKEDELQVSQHKIKKFQKILPKCAYCGKINIGDDQWLEIEEYLNSKENIGITHGICDRCAIKYFPELND